MAAVADAFTAVILLVLIGIMFTMVVARDVFNMGFAWLDDLARYLQIWVVYTAAIGLTMKGDHITMDAVYTRMPPGLRIWVRRLTGVLILVFCALTFVFALREALGVIRLGEVSSSGVLPAILGYASLPVGFLLMSLASIYYLVYRSHRDDVVIHHERDEVA